MPSARDQLEDENAKLKRIVADQALDITMLKDRKPGDKKNGGRAYAAALPGEAEA